MSIYRHTALPNEPLNNFCIRLLKLVKSRDTWLYGELKVVSLEKKPEYDALSYAWGSCDPTHKIFIDGSPLPISRNLHVVLRQFERGIQKQKVKWLWVDAICIDQNSIEERNHQITLMDMIYSMASNVLIWLGELTPMTELAMKWFDQLHATAMLAQKKNQEGMIEGCVHRFEGKAFLFFAMSGCQLKSCERLNTLIIILAIQCS